MTSPSTSSPDQQSSLPKTYEPQAIEARLYAEWEANGLFKPEVADTSADKFSLVIPPPNVTGVLHMGHALDNTIQDILVRWHRMLGHRTLWMPGTDHAGIATQNVVEKQLRQKGQNKDDLGREEFLKLVWDWANTSKSQILGQLRRLGVSPDWSRERFTLDEGCSKAVRHAFATLYKEDLIYQGTYIVNWCPRCVSAISDIETDFEDEESSLWEIAYPLKEGPGQIVVATTRPETMFGDAAVAVNPKDPRYQHHIGKTVILPLSGREIPVIGDEYVDTAFGTGALKITPAHDTNDFKIGMAHKLEPIWVLDERGHLKKDEAVPAELQGLERFAAREKTEELLKEQGYLVRKLDHSHRVGHCQRCNSTIEPLLSKQWFVRTKPLAEKCLAALEKGEIKFIPERWTKDYVRWLNDIQDWCISRQLWWGHQIPAWTCEDCNEVIVSETDPTNCKCGSSKLTQEEDVLDTWFSSGLWPFSTMGWPDLDAPDFKNYYPTDVLVTGFDIIFFWVARMTMFGHQLTGKSPFHTVYIHGLIRDEKGQKMSKSKGNTVDPVEMINEIGCDGFRFGLTSLITYGGQDIKLAKDKMELGRFFTNKIWNAARYVMMNLDENSLEPPSTDNASQMDRWILLNFNLTARQANECLKDYRFGELADILYDFIWNKFCDWYIEYSKCQLKNPEMRQNTQRILNHVLNGILRLLHPIMPYITEEIYQTILKKPDAPKSIMIAPYPQYDKSQDWQPLAGDKFVEYIDNVLGVIQSIRNIRQTYNIPHPTHVNVIIEPSSGVFKAFLDESVLRHFVKIDQLTILDPKQTADVNKRHFATNVVSGTTVLVDLENIIDIGQEKQRLTKKRDVLLKEHDQLFRMLNNFEFIEKAPPDVVAKNKARLEEINGQMGVIEEQLRSLK